MNDLAAGVFKSALSEQDVKAGFVPLLGDLATVPADYLREVAQTKRGLERWVSDANFRAAYEDDPIAALAGAKIDLTPDQMTPLIQREAALRLNEAINAGETDSYPTSVLRYRAFIREKIRHRREHRLDNEPRHPRMAKWWRRQVYRLAGQLGSQKADRIVHAPAAFELSKGCSVHCWFCALRAEHLEANWEYGPETSREWREILTLMQELLGPALRQSFCYWATEPLDNPDYERFLGDFHAVLGGCPQTTTARPTADIERTRRLLRLTYSYGVNIDRFSILSLGVFNRVHEAFSAEELLRVELLPQNPDADERHKKALVGRAQDHAQQRARELNAESASSTTACLSGFLLNMVERRVELITPCPASARWPLGFWVIDAATFSSPADLDAIMRRMIAEHMPSDLPLLEPVRLRPDLSVRMIDETSLKLQSRLTLTISSQPGARQLADLLANGNCSPAEIAERRELEADVPQAETLYLLQDLFDKGIFDEEPRPAAE